jgi:Domain of unknown function (DUF4112)
MGRVDANNLGFDFSRPHSRREGIARLDGLATLLDTALLIRGINTRFGLDVLIGLIPGIGDAVTTVMFQYIVSPGSPGTSLRACWQMSRSTW